MPHSKEWAITSNGGELIVGSNGMIYWRQMEIKVHKHGNQIRKMQQDQPEGLNKSLACEKLIEWEPASLHFPLLAHRQR